MRTTLTLDDDVAAMLKQVMDRQNSTLKALVNDAMRLGLLAMAEPAVQRAPFRTKTVDVGRCLVPSLDNIAEVLSTIEGEGRR